MPIAVSDLPGKFNFGATISGLDWRDLEDQAVRTSLMNIWLEKGVLVFPGAIDSRDFHVKLSKMFGELEVHPLAMARSSDNPEITTIKYQPGSSPVIAVGGKELGGYLPWHSDLIYVDRINRGGLLRGIVIPEAGGETGFIDQIDLYNTLPERLRALVEDLRIVYRYNPAVKKFGKNPDLSRMLPALGAFDPEEYAHVTHPAVFAQPGTGRKVLNVSPWFAVAVEGMENARGDQILSDIIGHCEDDRRAYYHQWRRGDMVLWDNWRMIHSCPGVREDIPRHLERTTIKGDYELGRVLAGGPAIRERHRVSI